MPPKKEKLSEEKLLKDYKIKFEGPAPPRDWPDLYSYYFQVIRDIWANRFNDFKSRYTPTQKSRVRNLRQKAIDLSNDISVNEATWRTSVEPLVLERFDNNVICQRCGGEIWMTDYAAEPLDRYARLDLKNKRNNRKPCDDHIRSSRTKFQDEDERGTIFKHSTSREVLHDQNDKLDNTGVPMSPDRVIGLNLTSSLQPPNRFNHLTHFPIKGRHTILYPFLVVEAKKEKNAPGFKAVERQTAFPIRRFLKIQKELHNASGATCEPPLVWFLAYQGEEWRLYAGTLFGDKRVRVYDLWHGTIESEDGAFQLFQIVDYIWTWARDIYRPAIRGCLRGQDAGSREHSQASTSRTRHSLSVPCQFDSHSAPGILQSVEETEALSLENNWPLATDLGDGMEMDSEHDFFSDIQDASSHPFLRWATGHELSPSWTAIHSIRHSDIVAFSFRTLEPGGWDELEPWLSNVDTGPMHIYAIPVRRKHLSELHRYWTGEIGDEIAGNQIICVSLLFHTYFQPENWQITRQICCLIWPSQLTSPIQTLGSGESRLHIKQQQPQLSTLIQLFRHLRGIHGSHSVLHALQGQSLVLADNRSFSQGIDEIHWSQPEVAGISDSLFQSWIRIFDSAAQSSKDFRLSYRDSPLSLRIVQPNEQYQVTDPVSPLLANETSEEDGIIAVKSSSWPAECPKFCLFVSLRENFDNRASLGSLLYRTLRARNIYLNDSEELNDHDRRILRNWVDAFKDS
ncbi:hypothetical protein CC78DRAFT_621936 [Lojkania enalia]|uniref:Uncharacterized protein n=1 Tax=Lojkania enalia TaxID=147567 RepID=A0A9P4K062_9PLEO|nr:hypothetical protein CC78DRAFT_621936 [Didymosphaeria enalia]